MRGGGRWADHRFGWVCNVLKDGRLADDTNDRLPHLFAEPSFSYFSRNMGYGWAPTHQFASHSVGRAFADHERGAFVGADLHRFHDVGLHGVLVLLAFTQCGGMHSRPSSVPARVATRPVQVELVGFAPITVVPSAKELPPDRLAADRAASAARMALGWKSRQSRLVNRTFGRVDG